MPRFALRHGAGEEPTSATVLRWGDYQGRYLIGTALILAGAAIIVQTTAYTLSLGVIASILHLIGWGIQPAKGWSRFLAAGPSLLFCWMTMSGADLIWILSGSLGFWLLVRRRPLVTAIVVALPLGVGILMAQLFDAGADKNLVFWVVLVSILVGAWLAREWALRVRVITTPADGTISKTMLANPAANIDAMSADTP